jgi:hypothetical protein
MPGELLAPALRDIGMDVSRGHRYEAVTTSVSLGCKGGAP